MANTTTRLRMRPVAEFIVPDWGGGGGGIKSTLA
jgi:hypothetical protein